jgi:hypothetical protein
MPQSDQHMPDTLQLDHACADRHVVDGIVHNARADVDRDRRSCLVVWAVLWFGHVLCGMCVTASRVRVQNATSCLYMASGQGHLEVVKYLCEQGGKELLMLTNKASAFRLMDLCFCMIYTYMGPEPLNT